MENIKYCYGCGTEYEGNQCPECADTIYTEKPNSQTKKQFGKGTFICSGGGISAFKTAIQKMNEYENEKMGLVFLISEQTETGSGGSTELIDTLCRFLPLNRIKELYLKYGIEILRKFKDKIDEDEQKIAFETFSVDELKLETALRRLEPIEDYTRLNLNRSNHRKKGKEIKSWNKTKFYQNC